MTLKKIKKHLSSKIDSHIIQIHDHSFLHKNYHNNKITHLSITIVSDNFIHKKVTSRHRMIFKILSEIIEKIYSITLNTYTIVEWKNKKNKTFPMEKCFQLKKL